MPSASYCQTKAAPEGSSLYYALLFTPKAIRPGLTALAAYRAEILAIPREVSDAGVAAVKLNWWQEELERLQRGEPRHPVTQALDPVLRTHQLKAEGLNEVIEAARMDLEYGRYPTLRELTLYCHRAGGAITEMAWRLCGSEGRDAAAFAHDLGIGLELTRMIRHLPTDTQAGRLYIPEDELHAAGLNAQTLTDPAKHAARRQLIDRQARRAQAFLDSAIGHLPRQARREQLPGVILAVLYRQLLEALRADDYPVFERQHHLTPLRKLWLAWRSARRPHAIQPQPQEAMS